MPAHIKSSMFGCSLTYVISHFLFLPSIMLFFYCVEVFNSLHLALCRIPITDGRLNTGTWQVREWTSDIQA
jgi:thiamine phosphate synthase YjbQ (UPF0047 family)